MSSRGRAKYARLNDVYVEHRDEFREVFGVPLSQFWDPQYGGFLMRAFCTQMLDGYMGDDPGGATTKAHTWRGRRAIRRIMESTALAW
jgi:hypothetical protein